MLFLVFAQDPVNESGQGPPLALIKSGGPGSGSGSPPPAAPATLPSGELSMPPSETPPVTEGAPLALLVPPPASGSPPVALPPVPPELLPATAGSPPAPCA